MGTFIDFERTVEEPKRRRNQPLPPLKFSALATTFQSLETFKLKDVKEIKEALTPTTCPSENGDDAAESEISFAEVRTWADIEVEEEKQVKSKPRRSGRARQREANRRRIRTPSPEYRYRWA